MATEAIIIVYYIEHFSLNTLMVLSGASAWNAFIPAFATNLYEIMFVRI